MSSALRRRPVWAAAGGAVIAAVCSLAWVEPAGGAPVHARVVGSEPADGAVVDRAPNTVTIVVDAKPATLEGDPLQVYGPDGHRIDDGRTSQSDGGHRISVALTQVAGRPAGRYEVVYRIVSADTHVIAGRLEFHATQATPGNPSMPKGVVDPWSRPLVHGWPTEPWPALVAAMAGGVVLYRANRRHPRARLHSTRSREAAHHGWVR